VAFIIITLTPAHTRNMEPSSIEYPLYATMRRAEKLCRLTDAWEPLALPSLRILCHGRHVIRVIE
jgi:hypothetical protein